jgi:hypothetical protein
LSASYRFYIIAGAQLVIQSDSRNDVCSICFQVFNTCVAYPYIVTYLYHPSIAGDVVVLVVDQYPPTVHVYGHGITGILHSEILVAGSKLECVRADAYSRVVDSDLECPVRIAKLILEPREVACPAVCRCSYPVSYLYRDKTSHVFPGFHLCYCPGHI